MEPETPIFAAADDHVFLKHRPGECPLPGSCPYCDGGLAYCLRCEAAESELAGLCPGVPQHKRPLVQQIIAVGQNALVWLTGDPQEARSVETVPQALQVIEAALAAGASARNAEVGMQTALQRIREHHVTLNTERGRDPRHSQTLELVNEGLAWTRS